MADSDSPETEDRSMLDDAEERMERRARHQADAEKAQGNHHNKISGRQRAIERLAGKIKQIYFEDNVKAEFEIASAAETVDQAQTTAERARETGSTQDVIDNAEATTNLARQELEVKRSDWAAERAVILHMVELLEDGQYHWPLAPETKQAP
ncbi:hypothetical protein INS49_014078 [Diaporthe citri]|uniref:uncharacterized protein n=1 Tax=Diaporthe citri TaxID=83186 RepID=UPI001C8025FB|nr:uncharacterized protein INS49_014078 [Diaporthe citri]KAG6358194.1 hypothetical protein INS49_014078 [Diaporthe citri]